MKDGSSFNSLFWVDSTCGRMVSVSSGTDGGDGDQPPDSVKDKERICLLLIC